MLNSTVVDDHLDTKIRMEGEFLGKKKCCPFIAWGKMGWMLLWKSKTRKTWRVVVFLDGPNV